MNKKQKKMLARILIAAAMLIALKLIPVTGILQLALYLVVYGIIGYDILKKAWKGILNRQVFDENFLMAVATIGAIALAIYEKSGDYSEAIAVIMVINYVLFKYFAFKQPKPQTRWEKILDFFNVFS